MSNLSQERPQSRFRLAKVETPGGKLPPIAKQCEVGFEIPSAAVPFEPFEPEPLVLRVSVEASELASVELEASGFSEEELAQAREFAEEQKLEAPPAGIAPACELLVEIKPLAPPKSNPLADFAAVPLTPPAVASLAADLTTLHSRYVRGPKPATPSTAKAPETEKTAAAPKTPAPAKATEPPKPAEPAKSPQAAKAPEPAKPAEREAEHPPARKEPPKPEPAKAAEPAAKPEPSQKQPEPSPKPKISIRPPEPPKSVRPEIRRPTTMVARGNAAPAAQELPDSAPPPPPSPEPKVVPIRKPDPASAPVPRMTDAPMLGMSANASEGSGMGLKIGIAVGVLAVLGGAGLFIMKGGGAKTGASSAGSATDVAQALPVLGGAGWTTNWGNESSNNKGKQISLYRPTMAISDYRIEIQGQIEKKALGWIFRAHDPKNYYVMKLEWLKSGVEDPIPALIKYAVIDGKESTRTQVMLPLDNVTLTSMFKIRTDVKGNKFTTYINDKRVDYWTDDQIALGGAGLYADANERAIIKSTSIAGLR